MKRHALLLSALALVVLTGCGASDDVVAAQVKRAEAPLQSRVAELEEQLAASGEELRESEKKLNTADARAKAAMAPVQAKVEQDAAAVKAKEATVLAREKQSAPPRCRPRRTPRGQWHLRRRRRHSARHLQVRGRGRLLLGAARSGRRRHHRQQHRGRAFRRHRSSERLLSRGQQVRSLPQDWVTVRRRGFAQEVVHVGNVTMSWNTFPVATGAPKMSL